MRDRDAQLIWEALHCEKKVTCDKCNGDGCDHCNGTGKHVVKEDGEVCPKCGKVHTINAGCSKVHETDDSARHWEDPNPAAGSPLTTAEVLGQVYKEIDEYMTTAVFTVGGEDLKDNVLAIIKQYLVDNPAAVSAAPSRPTGPISSPARLSQSPHKPSGMAGPGMMP
tara:strand:- start:1321 stop:1821 length:501 start_codon:yes stop_codon:yes gene_type:complete